jgi:hypothetical protein
LEGTSATTDYAGSELLHVFSSNAAPFDQDTAYTKFHAFALLEHDGDFRAAARALAREGYGDQTMFPPLPDGGGELPDLIQRAFRRAVFSKMSKKRHGKK